MKKYVVPKIIIVEFKKDNDLLAGSYTYYRGRADEYFSTTTNERWSSTAERQWQLYGGHLRDNSTGKDIFAKQSSFEDE